MNRNTRLRPRLVDEFDLRGSRNGVKPRGWRWAVVTWGYVLAFVALGVALVVTQGCAGMAPIVSEDDCVKMVEQAYHDGYNAATQRLATLADSTFQARSK